MILPALARGHYECQKQVIVGVRPGGRIHKVDIVAQSPSKEQILVSLKWQQVSGTAEQKVPFEVISLVQAIRHSEGKYTRAYLVLGGLGWKLREFYLSGGLLTHLVNAELVRIVSLEDFVARANTTSL